MALHAAWRPLSNLQRGFSRAQYQHAGVGVGMEAALAQTGGKEIPTGATAGAGAAGADGADENGGGGAVMLMTVLQLRRHMAFVVDNLH